MKSARALSDGDLTRLIKIAGLFGSDKVGERAAAALMFWQLLRNHGLIAADVLKPALPAVQVVQPPPPAPGPRTWRVVAEELLMFHYGALRRNEPDFLSGLCAKGHVPSEKQSKWLTDIARRCGVPLWDPLP